MYYLNIRKLVKTENGEHMLNVILIQESLYISKFPPPLLLLLNNIKDKLYFFDHYYFFIAGSFGNLHKTEKENFMV
jgi:hypothetical protein